MHQLSKLAMRNSGTLPNSRTHDNHHQSLKDSWKEGTAIISEYHILQADAYSSTRAVKTRFHFGGGRVRHERTGNDKTRRKIHAPLN